MTEQTLSICPRCQQRFVRAMYSGDYEHKCFGDESLANESVLVIGNWQDYTGSDVNVQNALMQGQDNSLFGTRAWIEGQRFSPRDSRGFPVDLYRSRQHLESINESFFKKADMKQPRNPETYEDTIN